MRKYLAALSALLLLAGCSSAPAQNPPNPDQTPATKGTPTPSSDGTVLDGCPPDRTGPWTVESTDGGIFTITVGGSNALTVKAEQLRKAVKGAPVTYVTVSLDNRMATDSNYLYSLTIVTPDSRQVETMSSDDYLGAWQDLVPDTDNSGLYNRFVTLINESNKASTAVPGAKTEAMLAFKERVEPVRMYAYINGILHGKVEVCRS